MWFDENGIRIFEIKVARKKYYLKLVSEFLILKGTINNKLHKLLDFKRLVYNLLLPKST